MKLSASNETSAAKVRLKFNAQKREFLNVPDFSVGQLIAARRSSARKSKITSFTLTKSLAEL